MIISLGSNLSPWLSSLLFVAVTANEKTEKTVSKKKCFKVLNAIIF
jgi:hypothetical protein